MKTPTQKLARHAARSAQTPPTRQSKKKHPSGASKPHVPLAKRFVYGIGFSVWVVAAFAGAQLLILAALTLLAQAGISLPVSLNQTVLQTIVSVVVYALTITIAAGVPWLVFRQKLRLKDVGLAQTLPRWRDIGLAPVMFVGSMIATGIVMYLASLLPLGIDLDAKQQVGFENLTQRYEMLLAFFTLVVLAPICEELLFRGYLYGRIRQYYSALWTIVLTSLVFGAMHVYAGPGLPLQWNVMIGTAVLAVFIGILREYTGSIWAGILVHMLKNGVAFFILFVLPIIGISLVQ